MRLRDRPLEDAGMHDCRPGIDQSFRDTTGALKPAVRVEQKVGRAAMSGGIVGSREHEKNIHACAVPRKGQPIEIPTVAVDPERIGVENEEGVGAQFGQCLDDAACGIEQQTAFVGDHDPRPCAAGDMIDNLLRQVVDIDDRLPGTRRGQGIEPPVEQGLAGYAYHRLRHRIGQRSHALAEPSGQNHRRLHNMPNSA